MQVGAAQSVHVSKTAAASGSHESKLVDIQGERRSALRERLFGSLAAAIGGSALGAFAFAKGHGAAGAAMGAVGGLVAAAGFGAAIHGLFTLRNDDSVKSEVDRIISGYDKNGDGVLRSSTLDSRRSGYEHMGSGEVGRRRTGDGDVMFDVPPGSERLEYGKLVDIEPDHTNTYSIADAFRKHGTKHGDSSELTRDTIVGLALEHAGADGRLDEDELATFRTALGEQVVKPGETPAEWARQVIASDDRNDDGVITSRAPSDPRGDNDEATRFGTNGASGHPLMVAADTDPLVHGVASVDVKELTAYATRFDADGDGVLTNDEQRTMHDATPSIPVFAPGT